jgi:hypothetical protein
MGAAACLQVRLDAVILVVSSLLTSADTSHRLSYIPASPVRDEEPDLRAGVVGFLASGKVACRLLPRAQESPRRACAGSMVAVTMRSDAYLAYGAPKARKGDVGSDLPTVSAAGLPQ